MEDEGDAGPGYSGSGSSLCSSSAEQGPNETWRESLSDTAEPSLESRVADNVKVFRLRRMGNKSKKETALFLSSRLSHPDHEMEGSIEISSEAAIEA